MHSREVGSGTDPAKQLRDRVGVVRNADVRHQPHLHKQRMVGLDEIAVRIKQPALDGLLALRWLQNGDAEARSRGEPHADEVDIDAALPATTIEFKLNSLAHRRVAQLGDEFSRPLRGIDANHVDPRLQRLKVAE